MSMEITPGRGGINNLPHKLAEAKKRVHFTCRFHPTDWFHEVGCPHQSWTVEQLIEYIRELKAMNLVYQHELFGVPLSGQTTYTESPAPTEKPEKGEGG